MIRNATAVWNGSGKEGSGNLTTQSSVLNQTPYSWSSRFAEGIGTNPDELIAAAHAGCFTMKLTFILGEKGLTPERLETKCEITLENGTISKSQLTVKASVPGATPEIFNEAVKNAEQNCTVSKLLKAEIIASGELV